jgi:outer membrane protein
VRAGAGYVSPKSDNGTVDALGLGVEVDTATQFAFNVTYLMTDNFGVELLGALPFKHDVSVDTLGKVAEATHLPPTVALQYFFTPKSNIRPYVGAGINYTTFLDVETEGALAGTTLDLEDSWGYALEAGVDVDITKNMFFNVAVWYMDIDTKAKSSAAGDFTVTSIRGSLLSGWAGGSDREDGGPPALRRAAAEVLANPALPPYNLVNNDLLIYWVFSGKSAARSAPTV